MPEKSNKRAGVCLCGAVRFEADGEPHRVINCHCWSCRKHSGAPGATMAVYLAEKVQFTGEDRKIYASTPTVGRGFCGACGTTLTWETRLGDLGLVCAIHISAFDDPEALPPSCHSFYPEKISWFDFHDNLPRYQSFVKDGVLLRHGPEPRQGD